jgi:hypothetical protein
MKRRDFITLRGVGITCKAAVFALVGLAALATTIGLNRNAEDKRLFARGTELPADCNIGDPLFPCFDPRRGDPMVGGLLTWDPR